MTVIGLVSFGFKHGQPEPGPRLVVVDIRNRFPANPFKVPALRARDGRDPGVQAWIREQDPHFQIRVDLVIRELTANPEQQGVVYVGCTGGQHRSVMVAEQLGKYFGVPVLHRDL